MTLVCSGCYEDLYTKDEELMHVWVEFCDIFSNCHSVNTEFVVLNHFLIGEELCDQIQELERGRYLVSTDLDDRHIGIKLVGSKNSGFCANSGHSGNKLMLVYNEHEN